MIDCVKSPVDKRNANMNPAFQHKDIISCLESDESTRIENITMQIEGGDQ
ncbi:hypothetical protein DFE_2846 [Desulfovibrio ferrophilus]|uniref:Uncharacterized protein n=1 Tax=Desulfovibrio ferrophilus TaxID=241368 RepID=A0A2Z6B243_9BACT|nr:hypothetical protein DFE_2846 [Desulfovibrio ferrophilus]